jgi:hypothetical protein
MLDKTKCKRCFQKNEKKWDEPFWKDGFVECPFEELILIRQGEVVSKKNPYYDLLMAIYCTNDIDEPSPDFCCYQKTIFKKKIDLKFEDEDLNS